MLALAVAGAGNELHGHPNVTVLPVVELGIIVAFVAWGLRQVLFENPGYFPYFVISLAALWQGLILIATLRDGFVLIALPAFVARIATVLCLSCGAALLLLAVRLAELPHANPRTTRESTTDEPDPEQLHDAYGVS